MRLSAQPTKKTPFVEKILKTQEIYVPYIPKDGLIYKGVINHTKEGLQYIHEQCGIIAVILQDGSSLDFDHFMILKRYASLAKLLLEETIKQFHKIVVETAGKHTYTDDLEHYCYMKNIILERIEDHFRRIQNTILELESTFFFARNGCFSTSAIRRRTLHLYRVFQFFNIKLFNSIKRQRQWVNNRRRQHIKGDIWNIVLIGRRGTLV